MFRPFMLWLSRRAMRWFYRSHRVVADVAVPPAGAVLLIGNHPNDLPDVLTGYMCTDRPVRYLRWT
jgi:1-acyl-sn-glycerol-3-phosphate acyltransferase